MYNGFSEAKRREDERVRVTELRRSVNSMRFQKTKLKEMSDRAAERRDHWLAGAKQNQSIA